MTAAGLKRILILPANLSKGTVFSGLALSYVANRDPCLQLDAVHACQIQ